MANGRRSIFSRRQSLAPGSYDTPLADFLDAIPGYVNQYQQNQLQLQRQQLADKRYEDSVKRQEDRDNRADYERILSRLGKYDYANMKKVADQYGYEDDSMSFASMIETQGNTLSALRDKINQVQNLDAEATYFDYDEIVKDINPQDIEMLSDRDKFGYDTLVNAKKRFDTQRRTGMRTMSQSDKTKYENYNKLYLQAENALVKAYADLGVDIRGRDFEDSAGLLKTLSESGINPTDQVRSLTRDVNRFSGEIKKLDTAYKITEPVNELPGERVPPSITQDGVAPNPLAPNYDPAFFYTSNQLLDSGKIDSPSSALNVEEQAEAMYTLASATPDSPEYKEAEAKLGNMDSLNIFDPKPSGIIERLSVAGQERAKTGEGMRGIRPDSPLAKQPPVRDGSPEYYKRVADQAESAISESGAEERATVGGMQNPKDTQFYYGGDIDKAIEVENQKLINRDYIVIQAKKALSEIPKRKEYQDTIKKLTKIIRDNNKSQRWERAKGGAKLVTNFKNFDNIDEVSQDILASFENESEEEVESVLGSLIKAIAPIRADAPSGVRAPQD